MEGKQLCPLRAALCHEPAVAVMGASTAQGQRKCQECHLGEDWGGLSRRAAVCAGAANVTFDPALIVPLAVKPQSAPLVTWAPPEVPKLQDLRAGL